MKPPGVMPGTCNTNHRHIGAAIAIGENEMSDYYESICKLYEKTMQRLEAEDCQDEDRQFLKGEAHAYFTAMQLSEFHSTPDEPLAPVLTAEMATALDTLSTNNGLGFALQIASQLTGRNLAYWRKGQDDVHVELTITIKGRAALKAHQASAEGIQTS